MPCDGKSLFYDRLTASRRRRLCSCRRRRILSCQKPPVQFTASNGRSSGILPYGTDSPTTSTRHPTRPGIDLREAGRSRQFVANSPELPTPRPNHAWHAQTRRRLGVVLLLPGKTRMVGQAFGLRVREAVADESGILGSERGILGACQTDDEGGLAVHDEVLLQRGTLHLKVAVERRVRNAGHQAQGAALLVAVQRLGQVVVAPSGREDRRMNSCRVIALCSARDDTYFCADPYCAPTESHPFTGCIRLAPRDDRRTQRVSSHSLTRSVRSTGKRSRVGEEKGIGPCFRRTSGPDGKPSKPKNGPIPDRPVNAYGVQSLIRNARRTACGPSRRAAALKASESDSTSSWAAA